RTFRELERRPRGDGRFPLRGAPGGSAASDPVAPRRGSARSERRGLGGSALLRLAGFRSGEGPNGVARKGRGAQRPACPWWCRRIADTVTTSSLTISAVLSRLVCSGRHRSRPQSRDTLRWATPWRLGVYAAMA